MAFDFENGSYTDAAGRTVLDPAVYKDWQIGAAAEQALPPVDWFRQKLGLLPEELLPYGKTPKLDFLRIMERLKDRPDGKYIEVTAITPTPLGEGKSTTSLGLIEGLGRLGANVGGCLRQPSGGPTMNVKGTAAGGGNALLIPMTEFSLGLTGDINDIMNAHNLAMTALNARMQHERNYDDETLAKRGLRRLDIDPERVQWGFVLDFCCQALRKMRIGLGEGKMDGYPMDTCANIAVSSELMAILSVARDLEDLRRRIGSIVLAYDKQGRPVTTEDLEVAGAMTAWMRNTINPTLCYTVEHQPVLVHAGPFANIAIGQSSVIGDRLGLKLFDYHVTESGFAADIGFEKFWNVKCRLSGLKPDVSVLVATVRALKYNGGVPKAETGVENLEALEKGLPNLLQHVGNITKVYKLPCVVAINRFPQDTEAELKLVEDKCRELGVNVALSEVWGKGGEGGIALANEVIRLCDQPNDFTFSYELDKPIKEKIRDIVTKIYHGDDVAFTPNAEKQIKALTELGYDKMPICMAKTQYSFSDDPAKLGAPKGFTVTVRNVKVSAGAGFLVALTGEIMTMPGLPKVPAAERIDVDENGKISGLF